MFEAESLEQAGELCGAERSTQGDRQDPVQGLPSNTQQVKDFVGKYTQSVLKGIIVFINNTVASNLNLNNFERKVKFIFFFNKPSIL